MPQTFISLSSSLTTEMFKLLVTRQEAHTQRGCPALKERDGCVAGGGLGHSQLPAEPRSRGWRPGKATQACWKRMNAACGFQANNWQCLLPMTILALSRKKQEFWNTCMDHHEPGRFLLHQHSSDEVTVDINKCRILLFFCFLFLPNEIYQHWDHLHSSVN